MDLRRRVRVRFRVRQLLTALRAPPAVAAATTARGCRPSSLTDRLSAASCACACASLLSSCTAAQELKAECCPLKSYDTVYGTLVFASNHDVKVN